MALELFSGCGYIRNFTVHHFGRCGLPMTTTAVISSLIYCLLAYNPHIMWRKPFKGSQYHYWDKRDLQTHTWNCVILYTQINVTAAMGCLSLLVSYWHLLVLILSKKGKCILKLSSKNISNSIQHKSKKEPATLLFSLPKKPIYQCYWKTCWNVTIK